MQITLDYGRTGLAVEIPDRNLKAVLGLQPAPPLPDPDRAVRCMLEHPIGAPPLLTVAAGARSACILVCDITRPVPNETLLAPALAILGDAGIPDDRILILVATGLHRESTTAEVREMLGERIARRFRVESHDARDLRAHDQIGTAAGGVPVYLDRRYLAADLKITVGLIEPHLMAGFSGGRKVICPGIAAAETIRHFHGVSILQSPFATAGQVEGNPVHALSLEVARMAGCDFILNAAIDEQRRITGVFCGGMVEAWETGVEHVRTIARAPLEAPVDIVVTSAAGYPLDSTFYQSVKGLVGAMPAVRPGGAILMAAALQEGVGSAEFQGLLESSSSVEHLVSRIHRPDFFCIDQWQAQELARVRQHAEVAVYSEFMPDEILKSALVTPAASLEGALADAIRRRGPDAAVAVIPRGPYVLPVVAGSPIG